MVLPRHVRSALVVGWLPFQAAACASTYECPRVEGCAPIGEARSATEAEFLARLDAALYDEALVVGDCSSTLALRALDECGLDVCTEICRLHPLGGEPTAACAVRCEATRPTYDEHLRAILGAAARTPGLGTCDLCPRAAFGFCAEVWACVEG